MKGSPFYKCFGGLPPFSNDHNSPPSSHYGYDSDTSFDYVAEYNIINRMEAWWTLAVPLCKKVILSCLSGRQWCLDSSMGSCRTPQCNHVTKNNYFSQCHCFSQCHSVKVGMGPHMVERSRDEITTVVHNYPIHFYIVAM